MVIQLVILVYPILRSSKQAKPSRGKGIPKQNMSSLMQCSPIPKYKQF